MKIQSLTIERGAFSKSFSFANTANLIHSEKNSQGKTTLIRFLLYALGYPIPNTRGMKFDDYILTVVLKTERLGSIILIRTNKKQIILKTKKDKNTYDLPEELDSLHSSLFNTSSEYIVKNLLGAYYIDQEKGWTLLNRGKAIGNIRFNIEELLVGLGKKDIKKLKEKLNKEETKRDQYKQMLGLAKYSATLPNMESAIEEDTYAQLNEIHKKQTKVSSINVELKQTKDELERIQNVITSNITVKDYISNMELMAEIEPGKTILLTTDNIVGLQDSIDLLETKKDMLIQQQNKLKNNLKRENEELEKLTQQFQLWKEAESLEFFNASVKSMHLNKDQIHFNLDETKKNISALKQKIHNITTHDNESLKIMADTITKYSNELKLHLPNPYTYLFTDNLKELSGAILHKTIFIFRLAYINAIEKNIGVKLPIILDSPTGNELDKDNLNQMMNILERDYSNHQIIIASIYQDYPFSDMNSIEISFPII